LLEWKNSPVPNGNDTFRIEQGKRLVKRHYQRAQLNLQEAFPLQGTAPPSRRSRRGLFNFVGDIASSLFGTPSASDFAALRDAQTALASSMDEIVTTQRETIGVVNALNANQQKISVAVNRVTTQVNTLSGQYVRMMHDSIQWQLLREIIEELLSFRIELARYVTWTDRMANMRAACESNSQSELTDPSDFCRNYYKLTMLKLIISISIQIR